MAIRAFSACEFCDTAHHQKIATRPTGRPLFFGDPISWHRPDLTPRAVSSAIDPLIIFFEPSNMISRVFSLCACAMRFDLSRLVLISMASFPSKGTDHLAAASQLLAHPSARDAFPDEGRESRSREACAKEKLRQRMADIGRSLRKYEIGVVTNCARTQRWQGP
jgi:hypothetical protein